MSLLQRLVNCSTYLQFF